MSHIPQLERNGRNWRRRGCFIPSTAWTAVQEDLRLPCAEKKECKIHLSCTTLRGDPTATWTQSVFEYNVLTFRDCLHFRAEGSIIHSFNLEWDSRFLPKAGKFLQVCRMPHYRWRLLAYCPHISFLFSDTYPSKGAFLHTECMHVFLLSLLLNNLNTWPQS